MLAETANAYPCPICLSEQIAADRKACDTCVDVFQVADDKAACAATGLNKRVPIGPTDI